MISKGVVSLLYISGIQDGKYEVTDSITGDKKLKTELEIRVLCVNGIFVAGYSVGNIEIIRPERAFLDYRGDFLGLTPYDSVIMLGDKALAGSLQCLIVVPYSERYFTEMIVENSEIETAYKKRKFFRNGYSSYLFLFGSVVCEGSDRDTQLTINIESSKANENVMRYVKEDIKTAILLSGDMNVKRVLVNYEDADSFTIDIIDYCNTGLQLSESGSAIAGEFILGHIYEERGFLDVYFDSSYVDEVPNITFLTINSDGTLSRRGLSYTKWKIKQGIIRNANFMDDEGDEFIYSGMLSLMSISVKKLKVNAFSVQTQAGKRLLSAMKLLHRGGAVLAENGYCDYTYVNKDGEIHLPDGCVTWRVNRKDDIISDSDSVSSLYLPLSFKNVYFNTGIPNMRSVDLHYSGYDAEVVLNLLKQAYDFNMSFLILNGCPNISRLVLYADFARYLLGYTTEIGDIVTLLESHLDPFDDAEGYEVLSKVLHKIMQDVINIDLQVAKGYLNSLVGKSLSFVFYNHPVYMSAGFEDYVEENAGYTVSGSFARIVAYLEFVLRFCDAFDAKFALNKTDEYRFIERLKKYLSLQAIACQIPWLYEHIKENEDYAKKYDLLCSEYKSNKENKFEFNWEEI